MCPGMSDSLPDATQGQQAQPGSAQPGSAQPGSAQPSSAQPSQPAQPGNPEPSQPTPPSQPAEPHAFVPPTQPFSYAPAGPTAPADSTALPVGTTKPAKASGRGWLIFALIIALLGVVALGALSTYLWRVHAQYVAQNEELREVAESLGTDVAEMQAHIAEVQADLDETTAQLDEAKDTINGLANSEAQAGDDRQSLIDVATALEECADARQTLIDHLNEASRWTPESLRANEQDVTDYCNDVKATYDRIVND
jgi:hypothetical protein